MAEIVLQDHQISTLSPSLFAARTCSPEMDYDIREKFFSLYKPLRDSGTIPYFLHRVSTALYYYRPLLARLLRPTRTKNVLEIGCGMGWKALTWADMFANYVGVELNEESATQANALFQKYGMKNCRAISGNAEAVLQQPEKHGLPQVDVLVLFAVLEHLTIPERRSILRLAQDVYQRGGAILIGESPNRLCRFDQHTWQLPFTDWLPNELMDAYAAKSARTDLTYQLDAAGSRRLETLQRLGRGISYHEFECFWDQAIYEQMNLLNDGYGSELLNLHPLMHDEEDLLNFFHDNQLNVHRLFSRYWIEGLFAQQPTGQIPNGTLYLGPHQLGLRQVTERRRVYDLNEATLSPGTKEVLVIENPKQVGREAILLVNMMHSVGRLEVEEKPSGTRFEIDLGKIAAARLPLWHSQAALPLGSALDKAYRVKVVGKQSTLVCHGVLFV